MGKQKLYYVRRLIIERRGPHGLLSPVEGYAYGKIFSIHRWGGYVITHMPTGYIICTRSTLTEARETITALMALSVPWGSKNAQKIKQRKYRNLVATVIPLLKTIE